MKKMTVSITLNPQMKQFYTKLIDYDIVERIELLELLRLDMEKGIKLALVEITMMPGHSPDEFEWGYSGEILSMIQRQENHYICIMKGIAPKRYLSLFKDIGDIDLVWDTPTYLSQDERVLSVMGSEKDIENLLKGLKLIGTMNKISFQKPVLEGFSMLSCLTEKQRNVIIAAKKHGYYDYPRKTNPDKISKHLGISKATTIEHLRKAENRLINHILTGY